MNLHSTATEKEGLRLLQILVLVYLVLLGQLLFVGGSRRFFKYYPISKTCASAGFLVMAPFAWLTGQSNVSATAFTICKVALVLCAAGDVLLGFANIRGGSQGSIFKLGVMAFGLAHLVFCALYYTESQFYLLDLLPPLLCVTITFFLEKCKVLRLRKMRVPALCYSFLVGLMVTKAVGLTVWDGFYDQRHLLLAIGSVLFIVSDIILVFMYFGTALNDRKRHILRFFNLSTYYIGVLLIALSLFY